MKWWFKQLWPRTCWSVYEADGEPRLAIWRQWMGHVYGAVDMLFERA